MGTRSTTTVRDKHGEVVVTLYRQFDGFLSGHGEELANLCNLEVVNGFGSADKMGTHANGAGCLAAQIVAGLKKEIGGIYIVGAGDSQEYDYFVDVPETGTPQITVKSGEEQIFEGSPKALLSFIAKEPEA